MHRKNKRGFTLIEIVISMMFLSFGIMGVIALFFVGVTNGNLSIKNQRATIIADEVRQALLNAFKYPRTVVDPVNPEKTFKVYRFELPTSLDLTGGGPSTGLGESGPYDPDLTDEPSVINGFYFQISDDIDDLKNPEQILLPFTAEEVIEQRVLDLPFEAMTMNAGTLDPASLKQQVWSYRAYRFKSSELDSDQDDSEFYSFRIILRRSVRYPTTGKLTQGDLLVATVYVFRQYNYFLFGEDGTADPNAFEKYDDTYGYPTFEIDSDGNTDQTIQPILKYEFYIPA